MFYISTIRIYKTDENPFEKEVLIEHQNKENLDKEIAKSIANLFFPEINEVTISSDNSEIIFGENKAMVRVLSIDIVSEQFFALNSNRLITLAP
jgi:CO dehydrogenase/acetyl-CoA synthase gamma subunit (corrinoid Fe-S protein)